MKTSNKLYWILGAVCALNFAGHLVCYPFLPEQVPVHWNFAGVVDGFGPKWSALLLALLPPAMLVLFRFLPSIDPKGKNYGQSGVWRCFVLGLTLFFCAFTWLVELSVFGILPQQGGFVSVLIGGGMGILFIILGNYMPRIRQNYMFGMRTPWALADEHTWNRTQRMGGITFIVMGVSLLVLSLLAGLLGEMLTFVLILVFLLGGLLWSFVYSYLVYTKRMK